MAIHCLAFETAAIQDYLTDTGRLSDAVAASHLVDHLTGDLDQAADAVPDPPFDGSLLGRVLSTLGLQPVQALPAHEGEIAFSRRAGGAFIAFTASPAVRADLRRLWTVAVRHVAPGLNFRDGIGDHASDPLQAARAALRHAASRPSTTAVTLVAAGPLVRRVPRTGRAAVAFENLGAKGAEVVDAPTRAKHRHGTTQRGQRGPDPLTRHFSDDPALVWPRNLSHDSATGSDGASPDVFPFLPGQHDIAVVHADGNGVGLLLRTLDAACSDHPARYIAVYSAFSRALTQATRAAVNRATRQCLLPSVEHGVVPARPLVLGGDDLTIVLRPDVAIPFTEAFLLAFEDETRARLRHLAADAGLSAASLPLEEGLSAAAGIVFVKSTYPFAAASSLANEACQQAKAALQQAARTRAGGPSVRSAVSLRHVTAALPDARTGGGSRPSRSLPAYGVGALDGKGGLPALADLLRLSSALAREEVPRGSARQLLSALDAPGDVSQREHDRWRALLRERTPAAAAHIEAALQALGVPADSRLPCVTLADGQMATPLADALVVAGILAVGPVRAEAHAERVTDAV